MDYLQVLNLGKWTEEVKHLLQPPVGNKMLTNGQLQAFVVGGPNIRKDFHIEVGEEYFFQIVGDMRLDIMEKGKLKQVPIKEGEVFMLPSRIPHSPQRFPNTIGFVVERKRDPTELDGLRWYVGETSEILYEEWFHCVNLGTQIKDAIERFFATDDYKKGKPSSTFTDPKIEIDSTLTVPEPLNLKQWLKEHPTEKMLYDGDFKVQVTRGTTDKETDWRTQNGEVFFHQFKGHMELKVKKDDGTEDEKVFALNDDDMFLLPKGYAYKTKRSNEDAVGIEIFSIL